MNVGIAGHKNVEADPASILVRFGDHGNRRPLLLSLHAHFLQFRFVIRMSGGGVHDLGLVPTMDGDWSIIGRDVYARVSGHRKTFRFVLDKPSAGPQAAGASTGASFAASFSAHRLAYLPLCFALNFALCLLNLAFC